MFACDANDARTEVLLDSCTELDRVSVLRDRDEVARGDAPVVRVHARQCDLRGRSLELQLLDALDGRTGEERPVADELQSVADCLRLGKGRRLDMLGGLDVAAQRQALADLAEWEAAVDAL